MAFSLSDFLGRMGGDQPLTPDMSGLGALLRGPGGGASQLPIQHKGMFGIHGTMRDILGTLGDAFLAQDGKGPIYRTARDQERIGDIASQNGLDTQEGINAIAGIDPKLAEQLQGNMFLNQYRTARVDQQGQTLEDKRDAMTRGRVGGMLAGAKPGTPEFAKMFEQAKAYAKAKGVSWANDLDSLTTPEDIDAFVQGGILPEKQIQLNQGQQKINESGRHNQVQEGIGQQNADSNRVKAGAAASQAGTAAAIAPSRIQYNEAGADNASANAEFTRAGGDLGAGRGANVKPRRAKPNGGPAPTPGANGSPPVGYKNKHGLIFRGGNPNDPKNWSK